jgi:acyl-CoA dehydrogenase
MDALLTDEQIAFKQAIREWSDAKYPKTRVVELDNLGEFPEELWDDMAEMGFHGVGIAEEYEGQGGDVITQALLAQGLARNLAGLATLWGVPSFAGAKTVGAAGTEAQKAELLPKLAAGEIRVAIAITEPGGGTDLLGALRTRAVHDDDGWVLNGQKVWSTGAHVSDYVLVLARSDADAPAHKGMTLFLVPTSAEGLALRQIPKLGMKPMGSNEVFLDNVRVSDDAVLGEPGTGWKSLVGSLNNERIITAGFATGVLEGVLEAALAYVQEREAFGKPIGQFQALQHYIADIAAWKLQSELLTYYSARLQSEGKPCGTEATLAKLVTAEYANQAADLGIQILGGMGYSLETFMQLAWRDSRIFRIAPITSEMARNMIAESYGLPRSF